MSERVQGIDHENRLRGTQKYFEAGLVFSCVYFSEGIVDTFTAIGQVQVSLMHIYGEYPPLRIVRPVSLQFIPNATSASILVQVTSFNQVPKVLFKRIAAGLGQFDGVTDSDAPVLAGEFHDLQ